MEISRISIFKSQFDSGYTNVPDKLSSNTPLIDLIYTKFRQSFPYLEFNQIYAKKFEPLDSTSVTINVNEMVDDLYSYNYCIIITTNGDRFAYFIDDFAVENMFNNPTITFSIVRDLWVKYYDTIKSSMYATSINRRHVVDQIDGNINPFQNVVSKNIKCVKTLRNRGRRVLWLRYKLDPTVQIAVQDGDTYRIPVANLSYYGTYRYLFVPFAIFNNFTLQEGPITFIDSYGESETKLEGTFPQPRNNMTFGADLTFFPPFDYTLTSGTNEIIITSPNYIVTPISLFVLKSDNVYERIEAFKDSPSFAILDGLDVTPKTYTAQFNLINEYQCVDSYTFDNFGNGLLNVYPYNYYSVKLPDGSIKSIPNDRPISSIEVKFTPTDSGGSYSFKVTDLDGIDIISHNDTYTSFTSDKIIPFAIDAYTQFIATSGSSALTQYTYQLQQKSLENLQNTLNYQENKVGNTRTLLKSGRNIYAGAVSQNPAMVASGVKGIVNSGTALVFNKAQYEINQRSVELSTQNIYNQRESMLADLENTTISSGQSNNAIADIKFQDDIILFKNHFVEQDEIYEDIRSFVMCGANVSNVDNPLNNCRKIYDYVRTDDYDNPIITNPKHRQIINSIMSSGVRKWHIDNMINLQINYNVTNKTIESEE